MKNRSNRSKGIGTNGNTKSQSSPAKWWVFTLNNFENNTEDKIDPIDPIVALSSKYVIGKEIAPTTGTPHLQGYVELKKKMRLTELKRVAPTAHWEKCNNGKASIAYCAKGGDVITNIELPKPLQVIENLYPWQKDIEDLCKEEPDDRTVHWYWEEKGNVGKSAFCKYMVVNHKAIVIQGGAMRDIMNIVFNSDMDAQRIVILDIPRCAGGKVSYKSIECLKNGMITNTKYETGTKVFNPPHVIVFANAPPVLSGLSKDRWKVTCLDPIEVIQRRKEKQNEMIRQQIESMT